VDSKIVEAYKFFREHAGYIVGRNGVGALSLARDEAWAQEQGITFDWTDSIDEWDGCEPMAEGTLLCDCTMRDKDGKAIGGIGMVNEYPGGAYFRVIEAELASECRAECEDETNERSRAANQNIHTVSHP
jgi:hypothetical protein